ncbi:uncharacterized protein RAG0_00967 [Rhynchosporium agropyri]|uniref:Uncharacterized protein n=1 Tax=Rhynchosporium agropyri TaxID=914238 RepID=A0A1E1JVC7_9HELO|nr:uncharacterized protein RAG0_00967 [Rhynchosporium agropyri]
MSRYERIQRLDNQDEEVQGQDRDQDLDDPSPTKPRRQEAGAKPLPPPLPVLLLDLPDTNLNYHAASGSGNENSTTNSSSRFTGGFYSPLGGLNYLVNSITSLSSRSTRSTSYDMIDSDDFPDDADLGSTSKGSLPSETSRSQPRRCHIPPATAKRSQSYDPTAQTSPGRKPALRHPTPDLQVLKGAYTGNIEQLERTAERLSMTSSIDDAIKELHDEQKRNDSRRSSFLSSQGMQAISRQVSNASSIVEVNSAARSGGYSPAGFIMSPKSSFTTDTRARSASKSSKYGSRPEPEMEGRPLDSFVNMSFTNFSLPPADLNQTALIAEQDEHSSTLTRPVVDKLESPSMTDASPKRSVEADRPTTSASMNTIEQAKIWEDFDGEHGAPIPEYNLRDIGDPDSIGNIHGLAQNDYQRRVSGIDSIRSDGDAHRRASSGNRFSTASLPRPQSYADPGTGQQMVYYPAPVPMMLNLPQKLSKNPSAMARNQRRSQVMSGLPAAARQSAIWLPDVLENEANKDLAVDDDSHHQEHRAQHQRAIMCGRRLTQDVSHMPPQLRATTFFDLPGPSEVVQLKDKSAVATLDSILDASAHAPVSAFTDHAFAGHLGAEVYGRTQLRNSQSTSQLLDTQKKRTSSFNMLRGKRNSTSDLLASNTHPAIMSGVVESAVRMPLDDDEDEDKAKDTTPLNHSDGDARSRGVSGDFGHGGKDGDDEEPAEGRRDDEMYCGAPTTLLAELQLRKQQQKQRTRPLATAYPNGMHSTLLEIDAVAQVEQKSRRGKRINLAWEDPVVQAQEDGEGSDEDVPLAVLYAKKSQMRDMSRPMGLMERRDMEDNEPLSERRNRLQGRPLGGRAATTMNLSGPAPPQAEGETPQERLCQGEGGNENGLPTARPISGDFAAEMMSQFGGNLHNAKDKGKGKEAAPSPPSEEEETLGQRRKRLQAERAAHNLEVGITGDNQSERPELRNRRSMADILQAHPSAGADRIVNYQKPTTGLLGLHEKSSARRSSIMLNLGTPNRPAAQADTTPSSDFKRGQFNNGRGGIVPTPLPQAQQQVPYNMYGGNGLFPQPSIGNFNVYNPNGFNNQMMMPFASQYAMQMGMGYNPNALPMNMARGMPMGQGMEPLNQNQLDMVERWRQSVMQ